MTYEKVNLSTRDGICEAHVFTPATGKSWPAIIFYMDGLAIRPTLFSMAQRLADHGYFVLLPNLFYRAGPHDPLDPIQVFATGDVRKALSKLLDSTDNVRAIQDTTTFISYLDSRSDVSGTSIGAIGYCMGGAIALCAAGANPKRIAAVASFHAGNLVTNAPSSPHLFASAIKARVYVAGADNDTSYPPAMASKFESVLNAAGVEHRCEIYSGALHGWTMTDFPVYDQNEAERHWRELFTLFEVTLQGPQYL